MKINNSHKAENYSLSERKNVQAHINTDIYTFIYPDFYFLFKVFLNIKEYYHKNDVKHFMKTSFE